MTLADPWAELREKRDQLLRVQNARKSIERMHLRHGVTGGQRCGDCAHLFDHRGDYAGHFFKCHQHGYTNGPATDWRLKWPACGLFQKRDGTPARGVGSGREQHP